MRKHGVVVLAVIVLTILLAPPQEANPILAGWFNEFSCGSSGWRIEMHAQLSGSLDGWYLTSREGQAYFKNGIQLGGVFRVLTSESLLTSLTIDPPGDSLTLLSPQNYVEGQLMFGPNGFIAAPRVGQSICLRNGESWYYLDNTPTFGLTNDALNATGMIEGHVADTLGQPIGGVRVSYDYNQPDMYSNSAGNFSITTYAKLADLGFSHPNFVNTSCSQQIWPESTVTVNVTMRSLAGVGGTRDGSPHSFKLSANHPNPFNPTTTITYELLHRGPASLKVYDLRGKEVAILADEPQEAGKHSVVWNAGDFPSGVYFCELRAADRSSAIKLLLLR